MINRYLPYLDEDIDLTEPEDQVAWRLTLEPHAADLVATYGDLLSKHAMLHLSGFNEGPLHDLCLRALDQADRDLARLKQSLFN